MYFSLKEILSQNDKFTRIYDIVFNTRESIKVLINLRILKFLL